MNKIQATLNLSEGFGQIGEVVPFTESKFPAGEIYIRVEVPIGTRSVRVNSRGKGSDDIMRILIAVDALQRQGVRYIELFLPYFPYSRQDRVCRRGESFSLKVMAYQLASSGIDRIITYDVHSDVARTLLDHKLKNYHNHAEVLDFLKYVDPRANDKLVLICPDAGSAKRLTKLYEATDALEGIVYCSKKRVGGKVVVDDIEENLHGMTAVVIDDICDGGATFISLAKKLEERNAHQKHLFVSHGIFSNGTGRLMGAYNCIGSTNSMYDASVRIPGVKIFKLNF